VGTFATSLTAWILAAGSSSGPDVLTDKVDLIEINHCYDEKGQLVFDQLLFYDWCPATAHYNVRDWRLLKTPLQLPRRSYETGGFVAVWRDGTTMRKVYAETIRETWTQYDPEILEQQFLPKEQRRSFPKTTQRRRSVAPAGQNAATRLADQPDPAAALQR
jgi:hypothetical protein